MILSKKKFLTARLCFASFVLAASIAVTGCPKDPYTVASAGADDIAGSVSSAITVTTSLYNDKLIDQDEKNGVATVLLDVTNVNGEFIAQIKVLHAQPVATKSDYIRAASSFVDSAKRLLASGTLHVKNPAAQAKLDLAFNAIKTGLDGFVTTINNAKGS